jgi:hypothetical protein
MPHADGKLRAASWTSSSIRWPIAGSSPWAVASMKDGPRRAEVAHVAVGQREGADAP